MQRFKGRVVVISGGASGIGYATAERLGSEGAKVMLLDINQEALKERAETLKAQGVECGTFCFDAGSREQCHLAVQKSIDVFGSIDVLCNIAGFAICEHFLDITEAMWDKIVSVNLSGVFHLSQAAIPELLKTQGNIVNMASTAGLVGQAYTSAYGATKAAVVMLSKSLALEYSAQGLRVNALCPGAVNTPLSAGFSPPNNVSNELLGRVFPLLPMAEPKEIAAAVAWIASDEARFVTGAALPIDGGQTAG